MGIRTYTDLIAWQKAMDLVESIYLATAKLPTHEVYGLTSQIRRAAVSVPSNIAEGQGRRSDREFARFLSIATGSLREIETQLLICQRLKYLPKDDTAQLISQSSEIGKLIAGLINSIENSARSG